MICDLKYNSRQNDKTLGKWDHLVAEGHKELPPPLAPQLVAPRVDFPCQGKRAGLRAGEVHPLQLHHHLPHHVVPAVAVEGQDHKVEGENLEQ